MLTFKVCEYRLWHTLYRDGFALGVKELVVF
jgi:hypothetical protein